MHVDRRHMAAGSGLGHVDPAVARDRIQAVAGRPTAGAWVVAGMRIRPFFIFNRFFVVVFGPPLIIHILVIVFSFEGSHLALFID